MSKVPPAIRELARRLIALEAARDEQPLGDGFEVVRVCENLRLRLSKLAGDAGFRSLMSRAVALAKAEVPLLAAVQVRADGSLEGFDRPIPGQDTGSGDEAGVAIVAQLLGLLVTFIGEPLTHRLVRDAWPNASLAEPNPGSDEVL